MVDIYFDKNDSEYSDIIKCLEALYSSRAGSYPMARDFGIDYDMAVGLPLDVAKNNLALEIISKTEIYEPRVEVTDILFKVDAENGQLKPTVYVARREEEDDE